MKNEPPQNRDSTIHQSRIAQLERELANAHSVVAALTDLLHLQNRELRHIRFSSQSMSFKKHLSYMLRRFIYRQNKHLIPVPHTNDALEINLTELHPGIQVRLKKEGFWQRYIVATSRKIRGKPPRKKYDVYVASFYEIEGSAGSPSRNLASRYASILNQRGL